MSKRAGSKRLRSVGDVLPTVVKRFRLGDAVQQQRAAEVWRETVGDKIARHAEPASLERGVLVVFVDSPAWLTQLTYLKPELLRKLAPRLKKGALRDLRFRLGASRDR